MSIPHLYIALVFALLTNVLCSPFEPHALPAHGPWFEGWFTRITDPTAGRSVAVIVASYQKTGATNFTSSWAAALVQYPNGTMYTEQVFPKQSSVRITDRGHTVTHDSPRAQPAIFQVASELGLLKVNGSASSLHFIFPSGLEITASLASRVPWDSSCPDTCGPEGWTRYLPEKLLPTHYFVQTTASNANYSLNGVHGTGFGHQEVNYGGFFPDAWTWIQGATDQHTRLVVTGGAFTIAGLTTRQFIIAYRSSRFQWDFRGVDLDDIVSDVNGCNSTLQLSARTRLTKRSLKLTVSAHPNSFSKPLFFPTPQGWSDSPGSVESYAATAVIRLYQGEDLVESSVIHQVALEFGGSFRCNPAQTVPVSVFI